MRKLKIEDLDSMYECLTDKDVLKYMQIDGSQITKDSCKSFIKHSFTDTNKHFAIVDDSDRWIGTISLKHIDYKVGQAEYAIILSKYAQGKGFAYKATEDLLAYAFNVLNLNRVYLNVISDNQKANKLYSKVGFSYEGCFRKSISIRGKIYDLNWYSFLKDEYIKMHS